MLANSNCVQETFRASIIAQTNHFIKACLILEEASWYVTVLASWFPMLLLIGVWIFFMRQMQSGENKAMFLLDEIDKMGNNFHEEIGRAHV